MGHSVIGERSFAFAVRIVKMCGHLPSVVGKQLFRSGTSIGANVREALNSPTQPDFVNKLSIAQKECGETIYWLELLKETGYVKEGTVIDTALYKSIRQDAEELMKIIRSIILTSKENNKK